MTEKTILRGRRTVRRIAVLLTVILMTFTGSGQAVVKESAMLEAAFELLEEANPFVARYEQLTGRVINTLYTDGVPYYFGGLSGTKWNGYFYMSYPNYHVITCETKTGYFQRGKTYLYGLDCTGFTRHVFKACGREPHPPLSEILNNWDQRAFHLFDSREGFEAPPYPELKNTLQEGDLLVIKHENSETRHVMMYIGTLRDYGYNTQNEPELARWLDYPLVIHCGLSPFFGERFQQIIDENPDLYEGCTTTDGGVAISIVGVNPEDAPVHEHVQKTDYDWFVMNDGGYVLSVVNLSDVKTYAWYRNNS